MLKLQGQVSNINLSYKSDRMCDFDHFDFDHPDR